MAREREREAYQMRFRVHSDMCCHFLITGMWRQMQILHKCKHIRTVYTDKGIFIQHARPAAWPLHHSLCVFTHSVDFPCLFVCVWCGVVGFVFSSNPAELSIPAALLPKDTFVTLSFVILESPRLAGFSVCVCVCVVLDTTQLQPSFWPHYFTLHPSPRLPTPHNRSLPSFHSGLLSLSPSIPFSLSRFLSLRYIWFFFSISCHACNGVKIFPIRFQPITGPFAVSRLKSPMGFQNGVKCKDFSRREDKSVKVRLDGIMGNQAC